MSDALSRATDRAEAVAARGTREPNQTPRDRLWTAVWALVGVVALLLVATVANVVQNDEAKEDRQDLLDVACTIVEADEPPRPCRGR